MCIRDSNRREYSRKDREFDFLPSGIGDTGEECGGTVCGCEHVKTAGKPFPLEGGNTLLPPFGGDGITKGVVFGNKGNGEKRV